MALISAQIRKGSTVLLPWHIVGGFSEGCTMLELFQSIKNGSIDLGTSVFPEKLRDLPITVSVGKSKTDAFDNVMANMNVVQTVSLFGHYVRFNLVEDKDQKRSTACEMPSESGTEDSGAESGTYSTMYLVSVKNHILYICLIFHDILGIFSHHCSWVFS